MLSSRVVTVQENHRVDDLDEALMVLKFMMTTTPFIPHSAHIHIQPCLNMGIPQYELTIAALVRSEGDVPEPGEAPSPMLLADDDDDDNE